ncbi:hypothetical protein QBC39DRAFT_366299 [Podospora conica]|nr:hypothetical protein QBC39DRAFT_366299 [Schizothecium conicum]
MQTLARAKAAALADPEGFVADLTAGRVRSEGDPLMGATSYSSSSSSSDDEDDDEDDEDSDGTAARKRHRSNDSAPPWTRLPRPQTVVRCPPINWAQYGVVGESLDKLHAEQVAAPTAGVPAPLGPGGSYEFKAAVDGQQPPANRLVGVAAPYAPGKDKIEKVKGARR